MIWKMCWHSKQFLCKTETAKKVLFSLFFHSGYNEYPDVLLSFPVFNYSMLQTGCSEINCTLRRYLSNRKQRQSLDAKKGIQIFLSYLWFEKKRHRQVSGFGHVGIHRTSWCQLNQRRWRKYQLGKCLDCKQTIALWGVCMFWVNFQL